MCITLDGKRSSGRADDAPDSCRPCVPAIKKEGRCRRRARDECDAKIMHAIGGGRVVPSATSRMTTAAALGFVYVRFGGKRTSAQTRNGKGRDRSTWKLH